MTSPDKAAVAAVDYLSYAAAYLTAARGRLSDAGWSADARRVDALNEIVRRTAARIETDGPR